MSNYPPKENWPDFLPPEEESGQPADERGHSSYPVDNYSPSFDSIEWPANVSATDFAGRRQRRPKRKIPFRAANISKPTVNYVIVATCVGVWFMQLLFGSDFTYTFDLRPRLVAVEPWRLITSAFLHSPNSVLHLMMNMLALFWLGADLEKILGHAKYLALFLISALGGSVAFVFLASPNLSALGASGAIFGMFGAYAVFYKAFKQNMSGIIILLLLNLSMPLIVPGIAWQAHIGGLAAGALVTTLYLFFAHRGKSAWPWVGILALALLVLVFARASF